MRFSAVTSLLALGAPLSAMAAPATSSQGSIDSAMTVVSSLQATLMMHEANINYTLAGLPATLSDEQKSSASTAVTGEANAMSAAVQSAVASVKAIAQPSGSATPAQVQQSQEVTNALNGMTTTASGTVQRAAKVIGNENIVDVFGPFIGLLEDFVGGVEDVFAGLIPSVGLLADNLVLLLESILIV